MTEPTGPIVIDTARTRASLAFERLITRQTLWPTDRQLRALRRPTELQHWFGRRVPAAREA
jgi:hypothetical protein